MTNQSRYAAVSRRWSVLWYLYQTLYTSGAGFAFDVRQFASSNFHIRVPQGEHKRPMFALEFVSDGLRDPHSLTSQARYEYYDLYVRVNEVKSDELATSGSKKFPDVEVEVIKEELWGKLHRIMVPFYDYAQVYEATATSGRREKSGDFRLYIQESRRVSEGKDMNQNQLKIRLVAEV